MKLTAQPKKVKSALGKVSKGQVLKKREKDSQTKGKKNEVLMNMAVDSLSTPDKIKVAKSLKLKKVVSVAAPSISFQKPTKSSKKVDVSPKLAKAGGGPKLSLEKTGPLRPKKDKVADIRNVLYSEKATKNARAKVTDARSDVLNTGKITKKSKAGKEEEVTEPKVNTKTKSAKTNVKKVVPKKSGDQDTGLTEKLLEGVCASALKLLEVSQGTEEKKDLFDSLPQPILLVFNVFQIPKCPSRKLRCMLPNSIHTSDPDVCLIVPDLVRGRMRDVTFAKYVEQYEDKLKEAGVKGIKQIIPFAQLRAEYSQFELKRRLCRTFDAFLCDGRIQDHCTHFLGSALKSAKKVLMPIHALKTTGKNFEFKSDLQRQVNNSLQKVVFNLHTRGSDFSVPIGHSHLSEKQLAENIQTIWKFFKQELPGGIKNIRCAYLKGYKTMPVPLYASLVPENKVPVVKRLVKCETVEGELSTLPGYKAVVHPDGSVKLVNQQTAEDVQFMTDGSIKATKRTKESMENGNAKRMKSEDVAEVKVKVEDEDEEAEVNAAEMEYLSQWNEADSDEGDEDVPNIKKHQKTEPPKTNFKPAKNKKSAKKGISQKLNSVAPKKYKKQAGQKNAAKSKKA